MSLWAIIPVKPLRRGKSRLQSQFSQEERISLNKKLLIHSIQTLVKIEDIAHVMVISRDPEALSIAREHGARTVSEDSGSDLNKALNIATALVSSLGATGVLVIPADIPQLKKEDVQLLINSANISPVVVVTPDYNEEGTNGLLVMPPGKIEYQYGKNSFSRHLAQAKEKGIPSIIMKLESMEHDVDYPEDLIYLKGRVEDWISSG
jgi:2-phospho-L-lactate/phosphoenolpyruvate guanylyltransferase